MAIRWRIAILLAVITTINYIDRSVFGVVAPVVRDLFEIGDADYGTIAAGFLFAYGIGQLLAGPVIDKLGTKRAFGIAALLWSVATMLHALGRGLWSFFTLRVVLGLSEAANFPAATKAVAQWFPAKERSTAVAIFMLGAGLGAIITPPLTVWIMETLSWHWAFIIPALTMQGESLAINRHCSDGDINRYHCLAIRMELGQAYLTVFRHRWPSSIATRGLLYRPTM